MSLGPLSFSLVMIYNFIYFLISMFLYIFSPTISLIASIVFEFSLVLTIIHYYLICFDWNWQSKCIYSAWGIVSISIYIGSWYLIFMQ